MPETNILDSGSHCPPRATASNYGICGKGQNEQKCLGSHPPPNTECGDGYFPGEYCLPIHTEDALFALTTLKTIETLHFKGVSSTRTVDEETC